MTRRFSPLLGIAGALLLVGGGCSSGGKTPPSGPAKLSVEQTIDVEGGIPIEGEYSYVRVDRPGGEKVAETRLRPTRKRPWNARATIQLDPGSYKLISYQRISSGLFGPGISYEDTLAEPSHRCSTSFMISDNLSARVLVNFSSGCLIKVGD